MRITTTLDENSRTQNSLKTFRGILNKITPQNNEKLILELSILNFNDEQKVDAIINILFEHAVNSHSYIPQFVTVCRHLISLMSSAQFVIEENGEQKQLSFVDMLLKRCQIEFERDIYSNVDTESLISLIESASDSKQRILLINELDMKKMGAKIRFLGIVKFVGELYLHGILSEMSINSCIETLARRCDEEAIESLCTLIKKVGPKSKNDMAICRQSLENILLPIYKILQNYENNKQISSRLRFMIFDVFEMRSNGWTPRKAFEEVNPRKISEIHADSVVE